MGPLNGTEGSELHCNVTVYFLVFASESGRDLDLFLHKRTQKTKTKVNSLYLIQKELL